MKIDMDTMRIPIMLIAISCIMNCAGYSSPAAKKRLMECQENLVKLDGAKKNWAREWDKKSGDTPSKDDLWSVHHNGFVYDWPVCPSGGEYIIGPVGTDPQCSSGLPGHSLRSVGVPVN